MRIDELPDGTLIRRAPDPFSASALRKRYRLTGSDLTTVTSEPVCPYCGGTGEWIGGDESHPCWCQSERALLAGEMLRRRFAEWEFGSEWIAALDAALAAERKATVERIRAKAIPFGFDGALSTTMSIARVVAILDAEAAP